MKKSLFLIFTLLSFFLISDKVNALTLPKPQSIDIETYDYGVTNKGNYSVGTTSWYGMDLYLASNDTGGLVYSDSSRQNFWYAGNICNNKEITINVKTIAYYGNYNFIKQSGNLKLWNGSVAYTCALNSTSENGNVADWTCTGVIANTLMLTYENIEIENNGYYGVGIYTGSTYSCDATSSDIINNQTNNSNNIINNQNQNSQNIINNQNQNSQNIINNQNQNQQQTNQNLDNINNSLNDDSGVPQNDVSNKTNEWSSKLAGTGPVSNMVLMPITLLNGYINGFNSTCNSFNLGNLMGTDIILPCINISNYLGATLWNVIDILFSGFMIYAIGKKFVKIFNDFTNLRDNQMDDLYGGGK